MGKNTPRQPSFFKILAHDDFNSQLGIPQQFVNDHAEHFPEQATLRTESGKKTWFVKIEQIGSDRFFFTDGWNKFAEDVGLNFREFLVFWFDGVSKFKVSVYGLSGCEENLNFVSPETQRVDSDVTRGSRRNRSTKAGNKNKDVIGEAHARGIRGSRRNLKRKSETQNENVIAQKPDKIWRFVKKLQKHHVSELKIPNDFAMGTGISTMKKILLRKYLNRKKWSVNVRATKSREFALTAGWNEFLVGNKVSVSTKVSLTFVPGSGNVIEVKVMKRGKRGNRLFSPSNSGRGRAAKV